MEDSSSLVDLAVLMKEIAPTLVTPFRIIKRSMKRRRMLDNPYKKQNMKHTVGVVK